MLSIIIVNWNVKDLLIKNLESIFRFSKNVEYEVIVVDNGSSDGSVEEIKKQFVTEIASGKLKVLDTKTNNGFAKGNNIGYNVSQGEYLLFMNPDMELVENSFKIIVDYLNKHSEVGALGCTLNYPDLILQNMDRRVETHCMRLTCEDACNASLQKTVKNLPNFWSQVFVLLKLHHLFYNFKPVKDYLQRDFDYTEEQEVEQLMGAFIVIRREIFEKIGKWNEDYWLWWEDVELAYQLKKHEVKVVYAPITKVVHHESVSFAQNNSLTRQRRFNKGMLLYFKKHGSYWQYFMLLMLQPISLLLAWLTQILKVKMRQQSKI